MLRPNSVKLVEMDRPEVGGGVCLFLAVLFLFAACTGSGTQVPLPIEAPVKSTPPPPSTTRRSPSVTFIMGSDDWTYNQYYTMANYYYRLDSADRTDVVVDGLTSLSQVFDWLRSHPVTHTVTPPPPIDPSLPQPLSHLSPLHVPLPYRLVNIVSHGNEFIDLQATVTPNGPRISAASLHEAALIPPGSSVVDSNTLVYLHGCAVGQNQLLLDALAEAFGGGATVKASKLFEYYAYLSPNHNPQSISHYYARTWYAYYHPDSTIDERSLVRQLSKRYPADTVDWRAGLRRRFQNYPSELYHYSFVVPVRYTEYYDSPEDKPSVSSPKKRQQWIDNHPDFQSLLDSTHIPRQYFQVKFYRMTAVTDDDHIVTGLQARARAGVICLIQPLTASDLSEGESSHNTPFVPLPDDTAIFAFSRKM